MSVSCLYQCFVANEFSFMQLGNPVLEFATDFNSRAEFFWSHGLISDLTFKMFTSVCNYSRYVREYYNGAISPICSSVMSQVSTETSRFVDKYDVTLDVCISSVFSQTKVLNPQVSLSSDLDCALSQSHDCMQQAHWRSFNQISHGPNFKFIF